MIIFEYSITPIYRASGTPECIFRIAVMDDEKDNVETWFRDKKYLHTIPATEIEKIKSIIKAHPELFNIPAHLEPNNVSGGEEYSFTFSDGQNSVSFSGCNILDYGRKLRRNATLALRVSREIKETVLDSNSIKTMISTRLQHWPKYKTPSDRIKI